jgi:hypothetical protein
MVSLLLITTMISSIISLVQIQNNKITDLFN